MDPTMLWSCYNKEISFTRTTKPVSTRFFKDKAHKPHFLPPPPHTSFHELDPFPVWTHSKLSLQLDWNPLKNGHIWTIDFGTLENHRFSSLIDLIFNGQHHLKKTFQMHPYPFVGPTEPDGGGQQHPGETDSIIRFENLLCQSRFFS